MWQLEMADRRKRIYKKLFTREETIFNREEDSISSTSKYLWVTGCKRGCCGY